MDRFQGVLGLIFIFGLAFALSKSRKSIKWRPVIVGFLFQILIAFTLLNWGPGVKAVKWMAEKIALIADFTNEGVKFVFGDLIKEGSFVFALNILPIIIFVGAVVGVLYYWGAAQWFVEILGTAISKVMGTSKIESVWAATVVMLGVGEAPLLIAPYIKKVTKSELFTILSGGFASIAGSTLIGYALLGAPLEYLLIAGLMNAPAMLMLAKIFYPETEDATAGVNVRGFKDTESSNVLHAISRGALSGGQIAIIVGCLLIAFVSIIAMLNGFTGWIGSFFGNQTLSMQEILGWLLAPIAWLMGTPWQDALMVGSFIGDKTIVNEYLGYASLGKHIDSLDPKSVMIATFGLAGFANFGTIAVQIGTLGTLAPERRDEIAKMGMFALLAAILTNLSNAAVVGIVG